MVEVQKDYYTDESIGAGGVNFLQVAKILQCCIKNSQLVAAASPTGIAKFVNFHVQHV
jgi:hypothetical protein